MKRLRKNPTAQEIAEAERDFRRFHWGDEPLERLRRNAPAVKPGDALYALGELVEVVYETHKANKTYDFVHAFGDPLPVLAATRAGRLVIVGGGYRVRERGIVG